MKPLALIATFVLTSAPAAAQYGPSPARPAPPAGRTKQVQLPPIPNFVVGHSQRAGTSQIVEFVPRGQTVQRYNKMITLSSFVVKPGVTPPAILSAFAQRYRAACPRASVSPIVLGGGNGGVRIDCPRHPKTGKPETVFARAVSAYPAMAIVQYMTTYFTMPAEAAQARDFLGRVSVR